MFITALVICLVSGRVHADDPDHLMLTILVSGADVGKRPVIASVLTDLREYLRLPIRSASASVNEGGVAKIMIPRLSPGEYAISVFHDANDDGVLNFGWMGLPIESVGFSNNAETRFGPPSFSDARFRTSSSETVSVQLKKVR